MLLRYYLQLVRPANLVTAAADVLAGAAIACTGLQSWPVQPRDVITLVISCVCLYAGGVVLNDVYDAELDSVERPERLIPSGKIPVQNALWFGYVLLFLGMVSALRHSADSGLVAASVALLAVIYDKWAKHHPVAGPVFMGLCRGGSLLLGISLLESGLGSYYFYAIAPVAYIAAITLISRGEVHGGSKTNLAIALGLYLLVHIGQGYIAITNNNWLYYTPILLLHGLLIYTAWYEAWKNPTPGNVRKSVKNGVIGLIPLDAAWAAATGNLLIALIILALLPVSRLLAQRFSVT